MSSELIIILLIACCCCMIISGVGFWSCTGGTFDTDQFDSSKCLSRGTGFVYTDPNSTPTSLEFTTCIGSIDTNETKLCIDKNSGSAGIQWKWVDTDSAPLSAQGRLVVQSIEKETDENTTTTLCQDTLDSAIEFSTFQVTLNVNKPSPITCEGAVWGDWSPAVVRASLSKRRVTVSASLLLPRVNTSLRIILIAAGLANIVCCASHTSPMPPAPIFFWS